MPERVGGGYKSLCASFQGLIRWHVCGVRGCVVGLHYLGWSLECVLGLRPIVSSID